MTRPRQLHLGSGGWCSGSASDSSTLRNAGVGEKPRSRISAKRRT